MWHARALLLSRDRCLRPAALRAQPSGCLACCRPLLTRRRRRLPLPLLPASVEDQFEKELRRRGLDPTSSVSEESLSSAAQAQRRSAFEQQQQRRTAPRPPPSFRGEPEEDEVPPQLAKSRALNAEGLEVGRAGPCIHSNPARVHYSGATVLLTGRKHEGFWEGCIADLP